MQGTAEALGAVHSFIAEKVREIPQAAAKPDPVGILQPQTTMNPDRAKQVGRGSVGGGGQGPPGGAAPARGYLQG